MMALKLIEWCLEIKTAGEEERTTGGIGDSGKGRLGVDGG
jgi:hypothetical protein